MNTSSTTLLLVMLGAGLLPFVLVVTSSFVKLAVVLSLARTAIGTPQVPPNSVVTGLALVLSLVIMAPVGSQVGERLEQRWPQLQSADLGRVKESLAWSLEPLAGFMRRQAHPRHLEAVAEVFGASGQQAHGWPVLVTAFVISQLHEAFQIAFYVFLPFLVLDLLVASVLLSLGMHMLSPTTVSLPLKLLLFVFVDGWTILGTNLLGSYQV